MSRLGSHKGFTVTELLIVITIIAIMLGIATLSMSAYHRRALVKETARSIYGDLTEIRTAARVRQQAVLVNFTTTTSYTACIDADASNTCTAADTLILSRTFSGPVQLQGDTISGWVTTIPGTLTFNNMGMVSANRRIIVSLTIDPSRRYRVSIFLTGATMVEMSEDSGSTWTRAW